MQRTGARTARRADAEQNTARILEAAGAPSTLHPVDQGRHVFAGLPAEPLTAPVLSFLRSVLGS